MGVVTAIIIYLVNSSNSSPIVELRGTLRIDRYLGRGSKVSKKKEKISGEYYSNTSVDATEDGVKSPGRWSLFLKKLLWVLNSRALFRK